MRKLLSIALIAALIVSVTPIVGINMGINDNGVVYADTITIDEEHFPDACFRQFLRDSYGSSFDPTNIKDLDVSSQSIESLEGIQYFTSLEFLYCYDNNLSNLDVSHNTALRYLQCRDNNLISLDINHNTALESLGCNNNRLSTLDVSQNTVLDDLYCSGNYLSSLDVSHNTGLDRLYCENNTLSTLDVSQNTGLGELYCSGNYISSLDVSHNTALRYLQCSNNNLSSLDVSHNTSLYYLDCSDNNLSSLDISHNTDLWYLYCTNNNLGKLYVVEQLPYTCYYDNGVEIIYGVRPNGIGDFIIGRDSNNFVNHCNADKFNDCGYRSGKYCELLDFKYYNSLMNLEGSLDLNRINVITNKTKISMLYWKEGFGGICYGTAATMAMLKSGALEIGDLTDGNATSYYQLGSPVNDYKFGQMIYYYTLSQNTSIFDLATVASTQKDGVSGFSKYLVSVLQQYNKPYLFHVPGHTWIVTEVKTESDGSYTVEMFDENTVYRSKDDEDPWNSDNGYFTYMLISPDFESISFTQGSKEYFTTEDGKIVQVKNGVETVVNNIWISDPDRSDPEKMPMLKAEEQVENILDKCITIMFHNNSSISLSNNEGETMSYDAIDECISGDMRVEDIKSINYGENDYEYVVYVPKSNSYTVNTQSSDINVSLFSEDNTIAIKGTHINNITLDSSFNAVVEGESDGYTFDIASSVINDKNEVGLDLINISGEASDDLKVTNSTESFGIQSDSIVHRANVVIHSDNQETESNLNNATTINVKADNNITSDAQNEPESNERIYGQGRYDTAIEAAEKYKGSADSKFENVIVAYGRNFPDALAGGYLAKVKNAPILLVEPSQEDRIADYISKNISSGGKVYLLGGTGVVSPAFESKVKGKGIKTERLGGATRYETNMLILEAAGVTNQDILVCTGTGYADSLSASAVGKPILLVGDTLTDAQKSYIKGLSSDQFYLIGGTGAVKPAIETGLRNLGYSKIERLAGSTRYETSTAVAEKFFPKAKTVLLAYAQNFPDGLSGGPLAMKKNAPIILTASAKTEAAAKYVKETGALRSITLGGPTLISDIAVKAIMGR